MTLESLIAETSALIPVPDPAVEQQARAHLDTLTKPTGSLGRLEDLASQLIACNPTLANEPLRKAVYIFAADHGISAEGVSAYPAEVTTQMVLNFLSGGAAINVLARLHSADLRIVDAGVLGDLLPHPQLTSAKIRRGTRNMLHEPAMLVEELHAALILGFALADQAAADGHTCIALGEMGIANTSPASLLTSVLTSTSIAQVTGTGTGLDPAAHARKIATLTAVLTRHQTLIASPEPGFEPTPQATPNLTDDAALTRRTWDCTETLTLLRTLGGLEIAAMAAFYLRAATHRIALIADGFISSSAAAIALTLAPTLHPYLFAGHRSREPGHKILLAHMQLDPILSLDLRLGEGTGAVLAMPLLDSSLALYREMATFKSARVSSSR